MEKKAGIVDRKMSGFGNGVEEDFDSEEDWVYCDRLVLAIIRRDTSPIITEKQEVAIKPRARSMEEPTVRGEWERGVERGAAYPNKVFTNVSTSVMGLLTRLQD